ncbi:hypothetical protein [Pseudoalteromonas tunicata]|jgi:hypothetical protein|uniref:Uncharacterized protein n=1 Tax=Pseudoalteromonas tunicata D2 TaxID=87626 RepID=A4C8R7_9GAMM|nr:hypothetical protein [Pseudoalteromonas tunicata]ATC93485.1 hypothetical protein PTUN_a0737 [Pseudoalteromonas tunicata]EAR28982.1 hypothetical protein PTD2_08059 [Pseudoalteromonas tunicata D2]
MTATTDTPNYTNADHELALTFNLMRDIVVHAIDQVNFTIRNLNTRNTVGMLMQCEDTIVDLMPIVARIAQVYSDYQPVYNQMQFALNAVQIGGDPEQIELVGGAL